jgi:hypothetical protein
VGFHEIGYPSLERISPFAIDKVTNKVTNLYSSELIPRMTFTSWNHVQPLDSLHFDRSWNDIYFVF